MINPYSATIGSRLCMPTLVHVIIYSREQVSASITFRFLICKPLHVDLINLI
jgi:hypothetical protein